MICIAVEFHGSYWTANARHVNSRLSYTAANSDRELAIAIATAYAIKQS